jgi:hypothetical protein
MRFDIGRPTIGQPFVCSVPFGWTKDMWGLKLASVSLTALIKLLEESFQKFSSSPNTNMYYDILNHVLANDKLPTTCIGCEKHFNSLTSRCIHFYITTRLHFLKKSINRNRASRQTKQKMSKISKLTWFFCYYFLRCNESTLCLVESRVLQLSSPGVSDSSPSPVNGIRVRVMGLFDYFWINAAILTIIALPKLQ